MKLLTLNTHSLVNDERLGAWEKRFEVMVQAIIKGQYDVIALQEVNQTITSPSVEQKVLETSGFLCAGTVDSHGIKRDNVAFALAQRLRECGKEVFWSYSYCHIGYDIYEEGVAILILQKVFRAVQFRISPITLQNDWRYRTIVGIQAGGITYLSAHFGWWSESDDENGFRQQWDRLEKELQREKIESVVLMGDLNNEAAVEGKGYEYVQKKGFVDLVSKTTMFAEQEYNTIGSTIDGWEDSKKEPKRIDYILARGVNCTLERSRVVFNGRNIEQISDHYGVEIEINSIIPK